MMFRADSSGPAVVANHRYALRAFLGPSFAKMKGAGCALNFWYEKPGTFEPIVLLVWLRFHWLYI